MKNVKNLAMIALKSLVPILFIILMIEPLVPSIWDGLIAEGAPSTGIILFSIAMALDAAGLISAIATQAAKLGDKMHSLLMNLSIGAPILAKLPLFLAVFMPVEMNEANMPIVAVYAIAFIAFIVAGIVKTLKTTDDSKPFKRCAGLAFAIYVGGWTLTIPLLRFIPHLIAGMFILARYAVK
ncbi:hypothetical protein DMP07_03095 [Slackia faecicanis]|uniref:Uncharacterized protein n=1 Tax=Slackia faecicanis TaxID=255723 RepID=A0A3N0AGL1_9ACTN|nr:hypothetical protein [Slackia faecicanis]RNL20590.1 hypothetical protein DMP07_03095 [Slackia faecicanis]